MALEGVLEREPVVLVVGLADSIHTARWLNMARGRGIRFVLFPVYSSYPNPALGEYSPVSTAAELRTVPHDRMAFFDIQTVTAEAVAAIEAQVVFEPWDAAWLGHLKLTRPGHLAAAIRGLKPDLVHCMTVQFGGYLGLACKDYLKDEFPTWLLSNWGSDIYLFRKLPAHGDRLRRVLASIDAYHAECARDYEIVRDMGFAGYLFPPMPASGGMNFQTFPALDTFPVPSGRREIAIKGYHGWSGRSLHIFSALHMAADALRGFAIRVTLSGPATQQMGAALAEWDGLDVTMEPYLPDHADALKRLAQARVVVGLGISDGISTTLLEAMSVGTFPVQGSGSCGNEWFVPGETGIIVCPDDIRNLANQIQRVLSDDRLVDEAAVRNRRIVETRWDSSANGALAVSHYRALLDSAAL